MAATSVTRWMATKVARRQGQAVSLAAPMEIAPIARPTYCTVPALNGSAAVDMTDRCDGNFLAWESAERNPCAAVEMASSDAPAIGKAVTIF